MVSLHLPQRLKSFDPDLVRGTTLYFVVRT